MGGDSESGNQLPPISCRILLRVRLGERQQPAPASFSDRREGGRRMNMSKMRTWRRSRLAHGEKGTVMEIRKRTITRKKKEV